MSFSIRSDPGYEPNLCRSCFVESYGGGLGTADIGRCSECKGPTPSGSNAVCDTCSEKLNKCLFCGRNIDPYEKEAARADGEKRVEEQLAWYKEQMARMRAP